MSGAKRPEKKYMVCTANLPSPHHYKLAAPRLFQTEWDAVCHVVAYVQEAAQHGSADCRERVNAVLHSIATNGGIHKLKLAMDRVRLAGYPMDSIYVSVSRVEEDGITTTPVLTVGL